MCHFSAGFSTYVQYVCHLKLRCVPKRYHNTFVTHYAHSFIAELFLKEFVAIV